MINLLPPTRKDALRFARRNTMLMRYVIGFGIGVIGVALVTVSGYWYLQQSAQDYTATIAEQNNMLIKQKQPETVKRVKEISTSLKLAVQVLSQEVQFSELIRQIGAAMPSGTILQSLQLSSDLNGGLDLVAGAVDYQSASQVQVNLEDPANQIFAKADIVSITCQKAMSDQPAIMYPCQVTLRALFGANNPFLLLSKSPEPAGKTK